MDLVSYGISAFFLLGYCGLLFYYTHSWQQLPGFSVEENAATPTTRITIIIPARNEAKNIGSCLESILIQDYPSSLLQVLVMNDHSTDDTELVVQNFSTKNVKLINLSDHIKSPINSYKKAAIDLAMQFTTGDLIVATDADCIAPKKWLHTIAVFYEKEQPAFMAMPVAYENCHSFIEIFQELDFMSLQGITGAAIQSKSYGMCNGANLAYEKSAFHAVNGFENIDEIASGDDMMLMHKITKMFPQRIAFLKSKDVIVRTSAMPTIARFFQQRIRWASKADKYEDNRITTVLFFLYFFHVWLFILFIYGLISWNTNAFYQLGILIILKTITELIFLIPVAQFFNKGRKLFLFPFAQPFHIIYTLVAGWLGKFGSYSWKGRQVK